MSAPESAPDDELADEADGQELPRERATTGTRRRIQTAEEFAGQAVVAETNGDHRTAADLYRKAVETLRPPPESAAASEDSRAHDATIGTWARDSPQRLIGAEVQSPILVVDDDADSRELVRMVLAFEGCDVIEAANGKEALALLTSSAVPEPCLIVLDLNMPNMTGWELIAILGGHQRLARIPVLVISGSDLDRQGMEHDGLVHYMRKPVNSEEITSRIRTILTKRRISK